MTAAAAVRPQGDERTGARTARRRNPPEGLPPARQPEALQPGIAIKLGATPGTIRSLPARTGEHTAAVLRELGYADAEIDALRAAGAV